MNIDLGKTQRFIEWLKEKIYLDAVSANAAKRRVIRGQVYRCKFGVGIGSEENKERPCVIIQNDSSNISSPNTIVAPITHTSSTLNTVVPIADQFDSAGNLILDGNVLTGNIVCVSKARLGNLITTLPTDEMKAVDKAIAISLNLYHYYNTKDNVCKDQEEHIKKLQEINKMSKETIDDLKKELSEANKGKV